MVRTELDKSIVARTTYKTRACRRSMDVVMERSQYEIICYVYITLIKTRLLPVKRQTCRVEVC